MLWDVRQFVLIVHILLAITWVGGVLFVGWGVFPATRILPYEQQRKFLHSLMRWNHWKLTIVGASVIGTGILLGTVLGPLKSWNAIWNTTYGHIWITALAIALFTLAWGVLVGYKYSIKLLANQTIWKDAEIGNRLALTKALLKTAMLESIEVIGFIVLIICMVYL